MLDISWVKLPTADKLDESAAQTGIKREYRTDGNALKCSVYGQLTPETEYEVKGVSKPISEWVKDMQVGRKLRGETPFRDSKSEAAFLALDQSGNPYLYDVGLNTTFKMAPQLEYAYDHKGRIVPCVHTYFVAMQTH